MTDTANPAVAMWASVAPRWAEHADYVDARGATITARMLELATVAPGQRVLELACGPGSVGLAAAERVGPSGEVVLSDGATEMVAVAAARSEALGLANVRHRVLDLDAIDEPDAGYDVVLCREGLMFAADHARAAAEIHRVLRPGGRAAIAVWGPRADNPWLGLVLDTVSDQVGIPIPPPGLHGPFALESREKLDTILRGAGFADVAIGELPTPVRAGSFDEWWTRTLALAGPLAGIVSGLPEETRAAITERLRADVRPYETSDAIELPGLTLLAIAHRR